MSDSFFPPVEISLFPFLSCILPSLQCLPKSNFYLFHELIALQFQREHFTRQLALQVRPSVMHHRRIKCNVDITRPKRERNANKPHSQLFCTIIRCIALFGGLIPTCCGSIIISSHAISAYGFTTKPRALVPFGRNLQIYFGCAFLTCRFGEVIGNDWRSEGGMTWCSVQQFPCYYQGNVCIVYIFVGDIALAMLKIRVVRMETVRHNRVDKYVNTELNLCQSTY